MLVGGLVVSFGSEVGLEEVLLAWAIWHSLLGFGGVELLFLGCTLDTFRDS